MKPKAKSTIIPHRNRERLFNGYLETTLLSQKSVVEVSLILGNRSGRRGRLLLSWTKGMLFSYVH